MHIRDEVLKKLKKKSDDATKALYKKFRNCVAVLLKEVKLTISIISSIQMEII